MPPKLTKILKVIIPALILGVGFSFLVVSAQPPTPPGGNPLPPINTTATNQIKEFANGKGFLGLGNLIGPSNKLKGGDATLCADSTGNIIRCISYQAPGASICIKRSVSTSSPDEDLGCETGASSLNREFGMTDQLEFSWSATKRTNGIAPTINFSPSSLVFTDSIPPVPFAFPAANVDQDTDTFGAIQSNNPLLVGLSASNFTNTTYGVEVTDTPTYPGPTMTSASATLTWQNKVYCGRSSVDYLTTSSFTYNDLTQNFNGLSQKLSSGYLPCVFSFTSTPEYAYIIAPDTFIANNVNALDPNNTSNVLGPINIGSGGFGRSTTSLTNKFNYTRNYYIYRSPYLYSGGLKAFQPIP